MNNTNNQLSSQRTQLTNSWLRWLLSLLSLVVLASTSAWAELKTYPLELKVTNNNGYGRVTLVNKGVATISVRLNLEGPNISSDKTWPILAVLKPNTSQQVARIFPTHKNKAAIYNITRSVGYGDLTAIHDPKTVYKLPFNNNKRFRVTQASDGPLTTHDKKYGKHAVDIGMPVGEPLLAMRAGTVIDVTTHFKTGGLKDNLKDKANRIVIEHDDGTVAYYAHLAPGRKRVDVGQQVDAGQLIGYSGNTGYSSGPHLHLSVSRPVIQHDDTFGQKTLPIKFATTDHAQSIVTAKTGTWLEANYNYDVAANDSKRTVDNAYQRTKAKNHRQNNETLAAINKTRTQAIDHSFAENKPIATLAQHSSNDKALWHKRSDGTVVGKIVSRRLPPLHVQQTTTNDAPSMTTFSDTLALAASLNESTDNTPPPLPARGNNKLNKQSAKSGLDKESKETTYQPDNNVRRIPNNTPTPHTTDSKDELSATWLDKLITLIDRITVSLFPPDTGDSPNDTAGQPANADTVASANNHWRGKIVKKTRYSQLTAHTSLAIGVGDKNWHALDDAPSGLQLIWPGETLKRQTP